MFGFSPFLKPRAFFLSLISAFISMLLSFAQSMELLIMNLLSNTYEPLPIGFTEAFSKASFCRSELIMDLQNKLSGLFSNMEGDCLWWIL